MIYNRFLSSDHFLHLYGPTVVHQEGKGHMLLKPVNSNDELLMDDDSDSSLGHAPGGPHSEIGYQRSDRQSLLGPEESAPPLPPRSTRHSMVGSFRGAAKMVSNLQSSFRQRGHSDATGIKTLAVPNADPAGRPLDARRRSSQKEDLDLIRHALMRNSSRVNEQEKNTLFNELFDRVFTFQKLVGRHQDDQQDKDTYDQLRERHVKAKRISQMMLMKQHQSEENHLRPPSLVMPSQQQLKHRSSGRTRHFNRKYFE